MRSTWHDDDDKADVVNDVDLVGCAKTKEQQKQYQQSVSII